MNVLNSEFFAQTTQSLLLDPVWASFSGPFSLWLIESLGDLLDLKGSPRVLVLAEWGWSLDMCVGATTYVHKRLLTL